MKESTETKLYVAMHVYLYLCLVGSMIYAAYHLRKKWEFSQGLMMIVGVVGILLSIVNIALYSDGINTGREVLKKLKNNKGGVLNRIVDNAYRGAG